MVRRISSIFFARALSILGRWCGRLMGSNLEGAVEGAGDEEAGEEDATFTENKKM
jgi:hypothetical protein